MVSNDILEYGKPKEVHNNHTSGYEIEVNLEIQQFGFTEKLKLDLEANKHSGIKTRSES